MKKDRLIVERTPYTDPLQQQWVALKEEQRRITQALRDLVQQMRIGTCDNCRKQFARKRPTKRYCSLRCSQLAAPSAHRTVDYALIREHWTLLEASGLLNPESTRALKAVVYGDADMGAAAGQIGVSRQRIHQIACRATQHMRIVMAVRNAVLAEKVSA